MSGLVVGDVTVSFDGSPAVSDVRLDVPQGQVLAVLGPSGSGKSTLLRVVAGLQVPDRGTVSFDGVDVSGVPTHKRGFGLLFQDGQLFAHLDVAANVAYPLRRRHVSRAAARKRVKELLELVGLPGTEGRRPTSLSGGQQQRVALARALAAEPRVLLLDEPLSALDRSLRDRLAGDLRGILTATGTTALLVTHDHDEALTIADRIALMRDGRIVQQGAAGQVWAHPVDEEAARFLGYSTVLRGEAAQALRTLAGLPAGATTELSPAETVPTPATGRHGAVAVREAMSPSAARASRTGLALRPGALRLDPAGPLAGTVRGMSSTADGVRLQVDIDGVGEAQAYAETGTVLAVGERVHLRLVVAATAAV